MPGLDVDTLLHESAQWKPETVEDGEVVGYSDAVRAVFNVPLKRTEATDQKQHDADTDVREHHAHPHLHRTSPAFINTKSIVIWKKTKSLLVCIRQVAYRQFAIVCFGWNVRTLKSPFLAVRHPI